MLLVFSVYQSLFKYSNTRHRFTEYPVPFITFNRLEMTSHFIVSARIQDILLHTEGQLSDNSRLSLSNDLAYLLNPASTRSANEERVRQEEVNDLIDNLNLHVLRNLFEDAIVRCERYSIQEFSNIVQHLTFTSSKYRNLSLNENPVLRSVLTSVHSFQTHDDNPEKWESSSFEQWLWSRSLLPRKPCYTRILIDFSKDLALLKRHTTKKRRLLMEEPMPIDEEEDPQYHSAARRRIDDETDENRSVSPSTSHDSGRTMDEESDREEVLEEDDDEEEVQGTTSSSSM